MVISQNAYPRNYPNFYLKKLKFFQGGGKWRSS